MTRHAVSVLIVDDHETFRSFGSRNFRLFFGGQLVSQAGTWMQSVAITWVVLDMTGSGVALGLVTAAEFLRRFTGDVPWAHVDIAGTAWAGTG
jgi:hypothetical protein